MALLLNILLNSAGVRFSSIANRFEFVENSNRELSNFKSCISKSSLIVASDVPLPHETLNLVTSTSSVGNFDEKSKKKKHRRRKRANTDLHEEKHQHVRFGSIEEIYFSRSLAFDRVPEKGLFPIGLGDELKRETKAIAELILPIEGIEFVKSRPRGYSTDSYLESCEFSKRTGSSNSLKPLSEADRLEIMSNIPNGNSVSDLNNEIKLVQSHRLNVGCNCKHIKVDKLSVTKMKIELIEIRDFCNLSIEVINSMTKSELTLKLKDSLKHCSLCTTNNCECVQNEVPCNAEICGCLKGNSIRSQPCRNSFGKLIFQSTAIKNYRQQILRSFVTHS